MDYRARNPESSRNDGCLEFSRGDKLVESQLLILESTQAELGARLAGLEGIVFALKRQLAVVLEGDLPLDEAAKPAAPARSQFADGPGNLRKL